MGYTALDVNVMSAENLKNVNLFTKMDVYVVVSISGDPRKQKFKTPVNHDTGSNPTWNFPIKFAVDESLAYQNCLSIVFKIKSKRILGDIDIGEVIVPVKELIDGKLLQFLDYQVRTPTGNSTGLLHFWYKFGHVVPAAAGTQYPPPHEACAYPPSQGYGYPPPQQHPGYGAYPVQGGYGYPPVQQQQQQQQAPKMNKLRMGLEAVLIGGRVGGLLNEDMDMFGDMDMGGFEYENSYE